VVSYTLNTPLPDGVHFESSTGLLWGTPGTAGNSSTYQIIATGGTALNSAGEQEAFNHTASAAFAVLDLTAGLQGRYTFDELQSTVCESDPAAHDQSGELTREYSSVHADIAGNSPGLDRLDNLGNCWRPLATDSCLHVQIRTENENGEARLVSGVVTKGCAISTDGSATADDYVDEYSVQISTDASGPAQQWSEVSPAGAAAIDNGFLSQNVVVTGQCDGVVSTGVFQCGTFSSVQWNYHVTSSFVIKMEYQMSSSGGSPASGARIDLYSDSGDADHIIIDGNGRRCRQPIVCRSNALSSSDWALAAAVGYVC